MDSTLTITQILAEARHRPRHWNAFKFRRGDIWLNVSWNEVYRSCEAVAGGLLKSGIKAGERVALLCETRREWVYSDFGIMGIGAVTVPIYPSQRPEEMTAIIKDSEAKLLILENNFQYRKWLEVRSQCPTVTAVILIDAPLEPPKDALTWDALLDLGHQLSRERPDFFEAAIAKQKLSQVATLIYTSGTTGEPKGVVLTHRQVMAEIEAILDVIPLDENDTSLSFLPYAHILGRVEGWAAVTAGFTLAFAESIDRLRFNLLDVKPTLLIAVPRVFEKLYAAIKSQSEANPALNKVFKWGLRVGKKVSDARRDRRRVPPDVLMRNMVAENIVFRAIKNKLGGRLRFAVSGGAPLGKEIAEFFHSIGLLILEGYGLTETTAAITANTPIAYKFGTVGKPLKGVRLKIAADGEILVKGPMVMVEYYNQPEANKAAFTDGYFHTGDIGEIDNDGFLRITDRKKDLIKTAGGKYVAPQKLENLLKLNPMISHALIHGDQEKYIVALLTLNAERVAEYARAHQISHQDIRTLSQHPHIKGLIRNLVAEVNAKLSSYETIKNFAILSYDFTVEAGELTPSLKVKRKFCSEKYKDALKALYE
jgi:long-chain acyl-CoA synthetase